jgi:hypothetical protein
MEETRSVQRLIGVYVEPHEKQWVKEKADELQWSLSLYCRNLIIEAMAQEETAGRQG